MNNKILESFFYEYQARFSTDTIRTYKTALRQFFSFCNKPHDEVKPKDVRAWLASMVTNGRKPRTISLKLTALKSFYQYCLEEKQLKKDPTLAVHSPKIDDELPYYLSKRQLALLQELAKKKLRDRAIVETFYKTGVRISELLNIRLVDVKWETRQIWIRKGKGNKERFVMFSHECAERLKAYLERRQIESEYLFSNWKGDPLSRDIVERHFRQYSEALGFKVTPHTMRHTFAAHLAEKKMPQSYIQELLGHVNINSTRIYTRLMEKDRKKQYDRYQ